MTERSPDGQITTEVRGHLYLIGLDRPEKFNGMTPKMFGELADAYNELERNGDLWVGVVFAHGNNFTAGLDLPKNLERLKGKAAPAKVDETAVDIMGLKRKCSKPVVYAVQGVTYTAGVEMMLAADIVIAASDCRFSQLEPKRGRMAGGGATVRFVERCGWGNAMYHLLRCDEFSSEEAYRIGLVQEVVQPGKQLERALEIANEISGMAPLAVQATKASSMKYVEEGEKAAIADFARACLSLEDTQDAAEGVASFVQRRAGRFIGK